MLTQNLAYELGARDLLRKGVAKVKGIQNRTIAIGEIEDKIYYAVNSSASLEVLQAIADIEQIPVSNIIVAAGTHAEVALYNFATSRGAELIAIGISDSRGPCSACAGVFDGVAVPVFFLGRIFLALIGGGG